MRLVGQHDQRWWLVRSLRHAPECAHLQRLDFLRAINFAFQPDFLRHLLRTLGEHGRSHAIARLVHQRAREVLRLADDTAFMDSHFQRRLIAQARDQRDLFHALILAIALVNIGIEIADERAFDGCAHRFCRATRNLRDCEC